MTKYQEALSIEDPMACDLGKCLWARVEARALLRPEGVTDQELRALMVACLWIASKFAAEDMWVLHVCRDVNKADPSLNLAKGDLLRAESEVLSMVEWDLLAGFPYEEGY